ncbi:protein disabled isoform X2 [Daktulosphaira vitifoliae]|uniref:protein disabled isoform X2 n=1 Tax=Daktulosphaira vitifoliae TaxID=58002 RepID=UPI0021AA6334|nr:protein disabled isoform X2 [Daktulosphaira vitifoliae]
MQTLRRKTSPFKSEKGGAIRFMGDGVSFKAKLIGILEVSEARGDRMCQEALFDLKVAIRAAGEHKQRITINVAIDGLKLRDEKTGDCLYHHPIHKISFIAQDMVDSRAFGYIFGSPDTGHRFFGIKTDKAASQVVVTMRDLFQTVFELKKQEIEMTRQQQIMKGSGLYLEALSHTTSKVDHIGNDDKRFNRESSYSDKLDLKNSTPNANDLLNLELELNNLQQGLSQMESITPPSSDPFGDSFTSLPAVALTKLPPPPSTGERRARNNTISNDQEEMHWFDKETESIFSLTNSSEVRESLKTADFKINDLSTSNHSPPKIDSFDVFTELDPLGTGRSKPYVDKKDFFQELKNPPKKILNQLVMPENDKTTELSQSLPPKMMSNSFSSDLSFKDTQGFVEDPFKIDPFNNNNNINKSNDSNSIEIEFADFSSFDSLKPVSPKLKQKTPLMQSDSSSSQNSIQGLLRVSLPSESQKSYNVSTSPKYTLIYKNKSKLKSRKTPSPEYYKKEEPTSPDDDYSVMKLMTLPQRIDIAPEPPPRPSSSMEPPPLPPKKQQVPIKNTKPTRSRNDHYDYIENYVSSYNITSTQQENEAPPLPLPSRKPKNEIKKKIEEELDSEYYLMPVNTKKSTSTVNNNEPNSNELKSSVPTSLDITLSQLTKTGFSDLADTLKISPNSLSKMTLQELTLRLSELTTKDTEELPQVDPKKTDEEKKEREKSLYDKYAVFRELLDEEKTSEIVRDEENDKYAALRNIDSTEEPTSEEKQQINVISNEKLTFEHNSNVISLNREDSESNFENNMNNDVVDEAVEDEIHSKITKVGVEILNEITNKKEDAVKNVEIQKDNMKIENLIKQEEKQYVIECQKEVLENVLKEPSCLKEEVLQPKSIDSIHCWATFDAESTENAMKKATSPWVSDDHEPMPKPKMHVRKIGSNLSKCSSSWDDCEESEDNWDTPKRSLDSSMEDFSSKNGWSDGESMYEDEPYYDRRPNRRNNRKISPRLREPSPWDDENMYSGEWESPYMFPPHWRIPSHIDDERRRTKDDKRRIYARPDIDRRIQKMGSAPNWEDEKYQRLMYERRRRFLEEQYSWDRYGPPMPPMSYPKSYPRPSVDNSDEEDLKMRYRLPKKSRYVSTTTPRKPRRLYHRRSEGSDEERNVVQSRKPYSQEDLDFSESEIEQNWPKKTKHKMWPSKRNQTSPFDDNFTNESPDSSSVFAKTTSTCSDLGYLTKPSPSTSSKTTNRVPSTRKPKRSDSGQRSVDSSNSKGDIYATSKHSPFEDDFTPPDAIEAKGSVSSEFSFKDDDVFAGKKSDKVVQEENVATDGIKKSDSINIFSRNADPFEDDDFFNQEVTNKQRMSASSEVSSAHETENRNKRPDRTKKE